jgi:hypothetical protein
MRMKKTISLVMTLLFAGVFYNLSNAQTSIITGKVESTVNNEKLAAVSVTVKGSSTGTFTRGQKRT